MNSCRVPRRRRRVISVSSVLEQAIPLRPINIGRSGGMRRRRLALKLQQLRLAAEGRDNEMEEGEDDGEAEGEAEEQGESLPEPKQGHIHILFKLLRYNGLSTYNYSEGQGEGSRFLKFVQIIWIIISFVQSLTEVKYVWTGAVTASKETEIGLYMQLAQRLFMTGIRFALLWTLLKKPSEISATIEAATRIHERDEQPLEVGSCATRSSEILIATIGPYTLGILLVSVKFFVRYRTLRDFLVYHSTFIKSTVLAWSSTTQYEIFKEEKETGGNIYLGFMYGMVNFGGIQLDQIAHSLVFVAILANFLAWRRFSLAQDATAEDFEEPGCLEKYAELKNVTKTSNEAFEMMFRIYFLRSIVECVILTERIFTPEEPILHRGLGVIHISMYLVALYMGHAIARKAAKAEDWARKQRAMLGYIHSGLDVLDEISEGPPGIGTGPMLINDSFVLGYFSVFVAYFFGIVETRRQQQADCDITSEPCTCICNCTLK